MKIKDLLTEDVVNVLSETSLDAIQEAFDKKVELTTEAALVEQDELYAKKLEELVLRIDKDHTSKMNRIIEAVDKDRAQKLMKVVNVYERALKEDGKTYKKQLVKSISRYLSEFLEESISKEDLAIAVKNKTAFNVLSELRSVLAVNSVVMKESVQEAILDGKTKLQVLETENKELKERYKTLEENYNNTRIRSLIEEKISDMPDEKKSFVRKTLGGKSYEFVKENFDYVSRLYDKKEKEKIKSITEDAKKKSNNLDIVPNIEKVIEEQLNIMEEGIDDSDIYIAELDRTFGRK